LLLLGGKVFFAAGQEADKEDCASPSREVFFRTKTRSAQREHKGLIPKNLTGDKGELFGKLVDSLWLGVRMLLLLFSCRRSFLSHEGTKRTKGHKGLIPKNMTGDKGELFVKLLFFVASCEKDSLCFSLRKIFSFPRRYEAHKGAQMADSEKYDWR
jgi:hypothetical protein